MHTNHEQSICRLVEYFQRDSSVDAILLAGSIAHGFETPASDIDIMLLVSDQHYNELSRQGALTATNKELCTYPGGYVDGKYIDLAFLRKVAERGSEPARFAFQDAQVLFSRTESLEGILKQIARYPTEGVGERLRQFYAQLEAWYWYLGESIRQNNQYLLWLSVSKLVLFGGRLILAHNRLLYPYHKWFLKVLESAKDKPADMLSSIDRLYQDATASNTQEYFELIKNFRDWGMAPSAWPMQFMKDVELNWLQGITPIDDL